MVGEYLLPALAAAGWQVEAFSRQAVDDTAPAVRWRRLSEFHSGTPAPAAQVPWWLCITPITILPEYFDALRAHGARRVVALSSTSRFTRTASSDERDQALARHLAEAESRVQGWAERLGATTWERINVYFMHEPTAPAYAQTLMSFGV